MSNRQKPLPRGIFTRTRRRHVEAQSRQQEFEFLEQLLQLEQLQQLKQQQQQQQQRRQRRWPRRPRRPRRRPTAATPGPRRRIVVLVLCALQSTP